MSQSYRLKISRTALKLRVAARIPAQFEALSPLVLNKTTGLYSLSLDIDELLPSLSGVLNGDFVGPASSTDNAAVRYDSTTGKLGQNSALIIADTTGSLSRSGNGGIPLQGTNTTDSAASGYVGEYMSATGTAVALTSGTTVNLCSLSLTPGDWDVSGAMIMNPAATTNYTIRDHSISTTSAVPNNAAGQYFLDRTSGLVPGANIGGEVVGPTRLSIAATTTVYLTGRAFFTVSTCTADGFIRARRVR